MDYKTKEAKHNQALLNLQKELHDQANSSKTSIKSKEFSVKKYEKEIDNVLQSYKGQTDINFSNYITFLHSIGYLSLMGKSESRINIDDNGNIINPECNYTGTLLSQNKAEKEFSMALWDYASMDNSICIDKLRAIIVILSQTTFASDSLIVSSLHQVQEDQIKEDVASSAKDVVNCLKILNHYNPPVKRNNFRCKTQCEEEQLNFIPATNNNSFKFAELHNKKVLDEINKYAGNNIIRKSNHGQSIQNDKQKHKSKIT